MILSAVCQKESTSIFCSDFHLCINADIVGNTPKQLKGANLSNVISQVLTLNVVPETFPCNYDDAKKHVSQSVSLSRAVAVTLPITEVSGATRHLQT